MLALGMAITRDLLMQYYHNKWWWYGTIVILRYELGQLEILSPKSCRSTLKSSNPDLIKQEYTIQIYNSQNMTWPNSVLWEERDNSYSQVLAVTKNRKHLQACKWPDHGCCTSGTSIRPGWHFRFKRRAKNSTKAFVYMELALIGVILNTLAHCGSTKGNIKECVKCCSLHHLVQTLN